MERGTFSFESAYKRLGYYTGKRQFFLQAGSSLQPAFYDERISVADRDFRTTDKQEPGSKSRMVERNFPTKMVVFKNKNENENIE